MLQTFSKRTRNLLLDKSIKF